MPEATEKQLEREVLHTILNEYGISQGYEPLTESIMETVRKAWIFGRDAGYREATLTNNN